MTENDEIEPIIMQLIIDCTAASWFYSSAAACGLSAIAESLVNIDVACRKQN